MPTHDAVSIADLEQAFRDLKKAIRLSGMKDGQLTAYDIDGTGRVIANAVCVLAGRRKVGEHES